MEPGAPRLRLAAWLATVALLGAAACGDAAEPAAATPAPAAEQPAATPAAPAGCADVVGVEATAAGDGSYHFAVTVESADTGWEKYADAWQVLGPGGDVLGNRELLHPHVDEQPFTRSLAGVVVPAGVTEVTVRARDSVAGWCGAERTVTLPR